MMIDQNRLLRNHVHNIRLKKDEYYVIVKIGNEDAFVEVKWNRWITMTENEKKDL